MNFDGIVGVVLSDVVDPFVGEVFRGIEHAAHEHNVTLMVFHAHNSPERGIEHLKFLTGLPVRKVLFAGIDSVEPRHTRALRSAIETYRKAGGRLICIGKQAIPEDAIAVDDRHAMHVLTNEIFKLGHKKYAVIAGPAMRLSAAERLQGIREAIEEAGLDFSRVCRVVQCTSAQESGASAVAELLEERSEFTALLCFNDRIAISAMQELKRRGISIPSDISVTGFGDIPAASDVYPALSTVHIPAVEIGERAFRRVLGEEDTGKMPVDSELRMRESTATASALAMHMLANAEALKVLSHREQQVAQLVGQGLTNRTIAQILIVGENTVEKHVTSILKKLGFRARSQLHTAASRISSHEDVRDLRSALYETVLRNVT